jgi:hypothetical protein
MRFLLLLHGDEGAEAALSREERMAIVERHVAFGAALRDRGRHVAGEALHGSDARVFVRPGDPPLVTDGPFATTKEVVGGFYVVECADRDEAIELAKQVPPSPGLAVEVIPVVEI